MLYPIAITHCDFKAFIKVCQDANIESPTRGLDSNRSTPNLASFAALVDGSNDPNLALKPDSVLCHVSITFAGTLDLDLFCKITNLCRLETLTRELKKSVFVVLTGTLVDWREAVVECCKDDELREIFTGVYRVLCTVGFGPLFERYKRIETSSGILFKC